MKKLFILSVLVVSTTAANAMASIIEVGGRFDYIHTSIDTIPAQPSSDLLTTSFLRLAQTQS